MVPHSERAFSLRWTAGDLDFDVRADGTVAGLSFRLGGERGPRRDSSRTGGRHGSRTKELSQGSGDRRFGGRARAGGRWGRGSGGAFRPAEGPDPGDDPPGRGARPRGEDRPGPARREGAEARLRPAAPTTITEVFERGGGPASTRSWRRAAKASGDLFMPEDKAEFGPCVTHPEKIICVGLNYRKHAAETGKPVPEPPSSSTSTTPRSTATAASSASRRRPPCSSTTRSSW